MIYTNNFKQFKKQDLFISFISEPYRSGYTKSGWFKTFKKLDDWKVYEIFFDKELNKNSKKELTWKVDFEWLKTYKKVYDIKFILKDDFEIIKYKNKVWEIIKETWKEVWVQWFSAFNVQEIMLSLWILDEIPTLDDWSLNRNFEEELILKLKWNFLYFVYSWEKLETRYTFRQWKQFEIINENWEDETKKSDKPKQFDVDYIFWNAKWSKDNKIDKEEKIDKDVAEILEKDKQFEEAINSNTKFDYWKLKNIKKEEEIDENDLPF